MHQHEGYPSLKLPRQKLGRDTSVQQ
jgi:hypothetical protein